MEVKKIKTEYVIVLGFYKGEPCHYVAKVYKSLKKAYKYWKWNIKGKEILGMKQDKFTVVQTTRSIITDQP